MMVNPIQNPVILFGLFALAAPILIHLIRRSRYQTLDWGAMQFLPDRITTQRRRLLDEILLMLLRMAMIALIVIALATPIVTSSWLAALSDRSTRDIVFVFDGSYSMDAHHPGQPTPWADSLRQAGELLDRASLGDRFTIVIARQPPLIWHSEFTGAGDELRAKLHSMPRPRGNPDMPGALAVAWQHLQTRSQATTKQIVIFSDPQNHGWADLATLAAFDNLGNQWHADIERSKQDGLAIPSLHVVKVGSDLPARAPNFSLAPIAASRHVARVNQKVTFQSALLLDGFDKYEKPRGVNILIDGKQVQTLPLPASSELKQGQLPLQFEHRFGKEGTHIVSLAVDADPLRDALSADNEQHAIIDVVKDLPILLVDGDREFSPESSSFFLQRALASKSVSAVPYPALQTALLSPEAAGGMKPAVLVLADVPRLTPAQIDAVDRFLTDGGALWIVAGPRMVKEKMFANDQLFRNGQGWLPAKLEEVGSAKDGVQPEPRTFQHPALEVFRTGPEGSMSQIRFSNWCGVKHDARNSATVVAMLSNGEPLLLEKPYKKARVILSTVPMDRRWNSTLPNAWEFPILAHELTYYLGGSRNASSRLQHGEPIRLNVPKGLKQFTLETPEVEKKKSDVNSGTWTYANTGAIGVYQVEAQGQSWVFTVAPELRESNLARMTDDDWRRVRDRLPVAWNTSGAIEGTTDSRLDLWWLLLVAVLGLLCMEGWMTRRMALARGR